MKRAAQYLVTVEYEGTSDSLAGFEIQHAIERSPDLRVRELAIVRHHTVVARKEPKPVRTKRGRHET